MAKFKVLKGSSLQPFLDAGGPSSEVRKGSVSRAPDGKHHYRVRFASVQGVPVQTAPGKQELQLVALDVEGNVYTYRKPKAQGKDGTGTGNKGGNWIRRTDRVVDPVGVKPIEHEDDE